MIPAESTITEATRIEIWRAETLEQLGVPDLQAAELAGNYLLDVAQAREYVARGCSLEAALELATREP